MIKSLVEQKTFNFCDEYNNLNKAQKEAVDRTEGAVMVVAGPGTGKTQIIAARIASIIQQNIKPENILCLTYTDAGTIAMRDRLLSFIGTDAYRINIFTFHAFCNTVIQNNSSYFGFNDLRPASELEKNEIVQKLLDALPHDNPLARDSGDLYGDTKNLLDLYATMKKENWDSATYVHAINTYIASLPTLPEMRYIKKYKLFKTGDLKVDAIQKETKKYERAKAAALTYDDFQRLMWEAGRYDFDDMIIWVINAFKNIPELLSDYQERYQYVLVDEFQDTSGSQNDLVDLLMSYWEDPNLFIVGDDDQSIYRFQGANIGNILSFNGKYSPQTIVLTDNYRSTQQILNTAMAFIEENVERLATGENFHGIGITKNLTAARLPPGERPEVRAYQTITLESLGVAFEIELRHKRGDELSSIAVLYRNHKQVELITRYLKAKGIPYSSRRREDVLTTPIVKQLLTILTYLNGEIHVPHSQERLLFLFLQHPSLGLTPLEVARLYREDSKKENKRTPIRERLPESPCASVHQLVETSITEYGAYSLQEYVHRVLTRFKILEFISLSDDAVLQMTALNTFFNFVKDECSKSPFMDLSNLIQSVEMMQSRKLSLTSERIEFAANGVNFITCHSSKGLEFETVFIIGCNESEWEGKRSISGFATPPSLLPQHDDGEGVKLEELRRLFYVAMTRAEKELIISYASRTDGDKDLGRSQFVAELEKSGTVVCFSCQLGSNELEAALPYVLKEQPTNLDDLFTSDLVLEWLKQYKLSISHLNTYLKCPRTFFFEKLLRVPQVKNGAMAFGTCAHAALEFSFKCMKGSPDQSFPTADEFIARFEKEMYRNQDAFDEVSFIRRLKSGGDNLRRYYELNSPAWYKKVLLEEAFEAVLDGKIPLNGLVDKLEIMGTKVNLVDYKTGTYHKSAFQTPDLVKVQKSIDKKDTPKHEDLHGGDYWRQAVFYKLLVENSPKHKYQVESTQFCFVEPDEKSGEFKDYSVEITPEDEETVRQQIVDVYGRIMKREFGGTCTDKYCRWCR